MDYYSFLLTVLLIGGTLFLVWLGVMIILGSIMTVGWKYFDWYKKELIIERAELGLTARWKHNDFIQFITASEAENLILHYASQKNLYTVTVTNEAAAYMGACREVL